MIEATEAYPMLRTRISDLVRGADGELPVPACPEWNVHHVLAHLVGVTSDVLAGRIDNVATDPWTAAQVDARLEASIADMLGEWEANAEAFDALIPAMGPTSGQLIFDTWTHEHDLRGALDRPGHRDGSEIALGIEFLTIWWTPPLRVVFENREITPGEGEPEATLSTSTFEFVRAVSGRRSERQVAAFDWDPAPRPDLLKFDFFGFRPTPLDE